ncbi:MAG: hypothetical protein KUG76_01095 [Gammaproteobacteria bacterium]|nr:hypothetical protein [Gammaproteobacteria bacterium]
MRGSFRIVFSYFPHAELVILASLAVDKKPFFGFVIALAFLVASNMWYELVLSPKGTISGYQNSAKTH